VNLRKSLLVNLLIIAKKHIPSPVREAAESPISPIDSSFFWKSYGFIIFLGGLTRNVNRCAFEILSEDVLPAWE
jgi:hypothetical protein